MSTRRAFLMGGSAAALGIAMNPVLPEQSIAAPAGPITVEAAPTPRVLVERLAEMQRLVDRMVRETCAFLVYRGGFTAEDLCVYLGNSTYSRKEIEKFAAHYPGDVEWDGRTCAYSELDQSNPLVSADAFTDNPANKVVLPYQEVCDRVVERVTSHLDCMPELVAGFGQPEEVYRR